MKYKTTKKAVTNGYWKVIAVPYCDLQSLLRFEDEIAYTTRSEGWGADVYHFGNIAIATGYAPFGNVRPGYEFNRRYEEQAREINGNYHAPFEETKAAITALLAAYIAEVAAL